MRHALLGAVLLAASCTGITSSPAGTVRSEPSVAPSSIPASASPLGSPTPLPPAREVVAGWASIGGLAISGRYLVWYGVRTGDFRAQPQQLLVMDRGTGEVSSLATAPGQRGLIGWLRISDEWVVWADYTDHSGATDWTVRYARLPHGSPQILMQAGPGTQTQDRPEFDLSRTVLAVTVRLPTSSRPELIRVDLATGSRRTLLQAQPGEFLGWPTIDGDTVYVESRTSAENRILAIADEGPATIAAASPASEPAASGGWLAYKSAFRAGDGPISIVPRAEGTPFISTDPIEAPATGGGTFAWKVARVETRLFAFDATTGRLYASAGIPRISSVLQVTAASDAVAYALGRVEPPLTWSIGVIQIPRP